MAAFSVFNVLFLGAITAFFVILFYALILAITALKIYIRKNS